MTSTYLVSLNQSQNNISSSASTALVQAYSIQVASSLTLLVGLIQVGMGVASLGFITRYFSDSFNSGYTCSCAVVVFISQVKDIFGFKNLVNYTGNFNIPKVFTCFLSCLMFK